MSNPIWQQLEDLASLASRTANKHYVAAIRTPSETLFRRLNEAANTITHTGVGTALSLPAVDNLLELVPVANRLARWKALPQLARRGRKIATSIERIAAEMLVAGIEYGNITLAPEPRS